MFKRIPKLAKITALAHFIFASGFFISGVIHSQLHSGTSEGYPSFFVVMMVILMSLDYPLAWLFENWSAIKSSPYLFFILLILFGTAMWFVIGLLLNKLINRLRKTKPPVLEERKTP